MVKTEAYGSFFYNTDEDSYKFTMSIPRGDCDGKTFETKEKELDYFKSKFEYLIVAFMKTECNFGEYEITPMGPPNSKSHP